MLASLLLVGASLAIPQGEAFPEALAPPINWDASGLWISGSEYWVTLSIEAPEAGMQLPLWALTAAAFNVGDKPLGERGKGILPLAPGQVIETRVNLTGAIEAVGPQGTFNLTCAIIGSDKTIVVLSPQPLKETIDFMTLPEEQLGGFEVVMLTNRGAMWFELWPEVAPNHVRNFLDLASSGYYDGSNFHRVVPGFMIQGGGAQPSKPAPRRVDAEFNGRKHHAGTLSAARLGNDINSATSQFFVMHKNYPSLNGRYTPYGKLKSGMEVVERIVITGDSRYSSNTPKGSTPTTPQDILRAIVVRAESTAGDGENK